MIGHPERPLRLGFPVKVMGRPDLKTQDTRRWRKGPHLKCSLELLDRVLDYLAKERLDMYRLSSDIAPYATHPDLPQFHMMVAESDAELRAFGAKARALDIRLSFHPSQYVLLNSPDPELTRRSIWDLASQAEMLDRMEQGPEAVLVTHVGGVYDDREASRARWIDGWTDAPSMSGRGWCWRMTTSASRRRTCCGSTNGPACAACSTISICGASTPSGWTCAIRWSVSSPPGPRGCAPRSTSPVRARSCAS